MDTGLAGRTVIVTGGNSNVGRGISLAFAAEGANVVIAARDEAAGRRVVQQAVERGAKDALWHATDVTDRAQVDAMVATAQQRFGAIDVLVNNVGGNVDFDLFVDSDPDTWQREIALNIMGTLNCSQAVLPQMIDRGDGRIINIGATAALIGDKMLTVYSATKGAVHTFTRALAREVGPQGITVNAIAPYGTQPDDWQNDVSTGSRWHPEGILPRTMATRGEQLATIGRKTNLARQSAYPSEIGAAAVYLASDGAAFVTGQVLIVDGGVLLA